MPHSRRRFILPLLVLLALLAVVRVAWMPRGADGGELLIYSGRSADLIQPLLDRFSDETGIRVRVRYGQTAAMAATLLEEGRHSPADLFFAQDAGALGALSRANRLEPLPETVLQRVAPRFRSPAGEWVGLSGRARVLIYHPERVAPESLPDRWADLSDPAWRGRVGWAPANGSFQAFVTALRVQQGDAATRDWLRRMRDNRTIAYANNTTIINAVAAGEIDIGLVNHYYLHALQQGQTRRVFSATITPPQGH